MMRSLRRAAVPALALLGIAACKADKLAIPQYNAPTVDGVGADANGVQLLATGILLLARGNNEGFIKDVGVFGRESYNYFPTDARTVSHYLIGQTVSGRKQLDPTGFASGNWNGHYRNMKNVANFIRVVDGRASLSAQEKAAAKGFAQTFRALEMWWLAVTRDSIGMPIAIPDDQSKPAPFVTRDAALQAVTATLDSARDNLQSAGATAFPFALHSGFSGFSTPATFLKFNRALAARVLADRATKGCGASCYAQALTALQASFVSPIGAAASLADLNAGPTNVFSSAAGDALNGMNTSVDPNYLAHAQAVKAAQLRADGSVDLRVARKITKLAVARPAPGSNNGIAAEYAFTIYPSTTTPVPLIRNEELILIRAEANLAGGNLVDALKDINTVRTVSGGLEPLASVGADPVGTLLRERWFSLLGEGHRWNDMRRAGRLGELPLDLASHFVARVMPVPKTECDARGGAGSAPGC